MGRGAGELSFSPSADVASFGHHFLIGLQKSPVLTDHDKHLLAALRPLGVVLFKDNFAHDLPYGEWLALHARQLDDVRAAIGRDRILVCIDHEGGLVHRTPPPITRFAAAASWPESAGAVGAAMGRELRSLGVNVDFAPVADVHLNPENPVIGDRAFGSSPQSAGTAAVSFLHGLQSAGVLGCGKHFPGHGVTAVDSHEELPVVDAPLAALRRREFVPFAALIDAGIRMMMTAHIDFPQVAPGVPATLSPYFLGDILRDELGFDGVVISDDVGMQAVAERFKLSETGAEALAAGLDVIAVCAHLADTRTALDLAAGMAAGWSAGELDPRRLEASHGRIERLLAAAQQHPVRELQPSDFASHRQVAPTIS